MHGPMNVKNILEWAVVLEGKLDETRCSDSICQTDLTWTEKWTQQVHHLLHVSAVLECHHQL